MVALRKTRSPLADSGIYIVASRRGSVRALVDSEVLGTVPQLDRAIECISHVLQRCVPDESLTVSVTFARGPSGN